MFVLQYDSQTFEIAGRVWLLWERRSSLSFIDSPAIPVNPTGTLADARHYPRLSHPHPIMVSGGCRGSDLTITELCLALKTKLIKAMDSPRCVPSHHTSSLNDEPMRGSFL